MTDKYSGGTVAVDVVEDEHGNQQAANANMGLKQVEKKTFVVEPGLIGVRPDEPIPIPGLGQGPMPSRGSYGPAPYSRAPPPPIPGRGLPPPPPGMSGHGGNIPPPHFAGGPSQNGPYPPRHNR